MTAIRILILGDIGVGKSAVTVRFLTKRFIGEYSSDVDLLYRSNVKHEDQLIDVELLDTCTRPGDETTVEENRTGWADAFVIVYSIVSRPSLHAARQIIQEVTRIRASSYIPIMLLANMADLDHRREVKSIEGHQIAVEMSCQYFEVSAAEDSVGITLAFHAFLREARAVQQQKATLMKRRRSSLATMSRRLGAMFGKKDSGSNGISSGSLSPTGTNCGLPTAMDVSPNLRRKSADSKDSPSKS